MRYLADTQLLIWATISPEKLSKAARTLLQDSDNEILFSAASIFEVAVKYSRGKNDFTLPPETLRRGLTDLGWKELLITSEHAIAITGLPQHHGDPFDRLLVAQAKTDGLLLITSDKILSKYPGTRHV